VESKICHYCWYYITDPTTSEIIDESEPVKIFPYCHFYNDNPSVKPDHSCENWASKKLRLISAIKGLYGL
jgi:hypothetical protein